MTQSDVSPLRPLLDRLTRLAGADAWAEDLTPTQMAVLDYLGRANRFSRAPSQVADYLGATRGTVSQTLKTLEQKGLVIEERSTEDKRRISYSLSQEGEMAVACPDTLGSVLSDLPPERRHAITIALEDLLKGLLSQRGNRPFGICQTCRHHETPKTGGARCALLNVLLLPQDVTRICHEHSPR